MGARRILVRSIGFAAAGAVVAIPLWLLLPLVGAGDPPRVGPSTTSTADVAVSPTPSREPFRAFVPPTYEEGGNEVLPVTFPDGTTAELVYPKDLALAALGVRPYWAGCARDFWFHYYDPFGVVYMGEPLQTWTGADGQTVGVWPAADDEPGVDYEPLVFLIFRFGSWTVGVYDYGGEAAMPDHARAACAEGLMGTVTDDGWIVMSGPPELQLGGEPELEFGGLGRAEPFVLFFPGPCNQNDYEGITVIDGIGVDLSKDFASWCHRGGEMEVHVYFQGEPVFVERLLADLQVRDLVPASG